jgi:hypothetical protein
MLPSSCLSISPLWLSGTKIEVPLRVRVPATTVGRQAAFPW